MEPTLLTQRPIQFTVFHDYITDVQPSDNLTELRTTHTGDMPEYNFEASFHMDDVGAIEQRLHMFNKGELPVTVPLHTQEVVFHDGNIFSDSRGYNLRATRQRGVTSRYIPFADPQLPGAHNKFFVNNQLMTVNRITHSTIRFVEPFNEENMNETIHIVAPAVEINNLDPQANTNRPNDNIIILRGKAPVYREPFFTDGVNESIENTILLNHDYIHNGYHLIRYDNNFKILDFQDGSGISIFKKVDKAIIWGNHTFTVDLGDWTKFQAFLNWAQGRRRTFLFSSKINDLNFKRFGNNRAQVVFDNNADVINTLFNEQRLLFRMPSGNEFPVKIINNLLIPGGNEFLAILESPVPGLETPILTSFLSVCRLRSDRVRLDYRGFVIDVSLSIQTVLEGEVEVAFPSPPDAAMRQHDLTQHNNDQFA